MKPAHVVQEQKSWVSQVNTGLQMKRAGGEMVAKALRVRLDKVGEKEWLQECKDEWGWGRTQAYAHLNPELLAKARERVAEARSYSTNAAPRQDDAFDPDPDDPLGDDGYYGPLSPPRHKATRQEWKPDQITEALSNLFKASKATPSSRYLANLQQMFDQGTGIDEGLKDAFVAIREWLDEVIQGIDPFIVSCEVNHSHDKEQSNA